MTMNGPRRESKTKPRGLLLGQKLILTFFGAQALLLVPGGFTEVVNFPRFLLLSVLGGLTCVFLAPRFLELLRGAENRVLFSLVGFLFLLWFAVFVSGADISDQLIGERGRNTGAITYSCLVVLSTYVFYMNSSNFMNWFVKISGALSGLMFLYVLIQKAGLDPMPWKNDSAWIIGTLGNPNFLSSYFGISFSLVLGALIHEINKPRKVFYFVLLVSQLYGIHASASKQGFLIAVIGTTILLFIFIIQRRRKLEIASFIILATLGGLFGLLGVLNKGPLSKLLYEDSVTYRGDYWRAGVSMGLNHPLFGIGIDQYGSNYRAYRDFDAAVRRGGEVTSDSAHNVFLDLFSGGGFPLLFAYIIIVASAIWAGIRHLRIMSSFDPIRACIYSALVAYLIQSAISINQITLGVFGWILIGLVLSLNREEPLQIQAKNKSVARMISLGFLATLMIPIINYSSFDYRFNRLVKVGNIQGVVELVSRVKADNYYRNFTAASIGGESAAEIKERLLSQSLSINPKDYVALELKKKLLIETGRKNEAEIIRRKQIEIDPFNPGIQAPIK